MNRTAPAIIVVGCLALTACGGGKDQPPRTTQPSSTRTTATDPTLDLKQAVRAAVRENNRLAGYVLWHNTIPTWAEQSTRGPALAGLRDSVAPRRKNRVRVRTLSSRLEIVELRLDPSYTQATVIARQVTRIAVYRRGRKSRRVTRLDERARIELHRLGRDPRFVVWEVHVVR